jgi:hypothetical protein
VNNTGTQGVIPPGFPICLVAGAVVQTLKVPALTCPMNAPPFRQDAIGEAIEWHRWQWRLINGEVDMYEVLDVLPGSPHLFISSCGTRGNHFQTPSLPHGFATPYQSTLHHGQAENHSPISPL